LTVLGEKLAGRNEKSLGDWEKVVRKRCQIESCGIKMSFQRLKTRETHEIHTKIDSQNARIPFLYTDASDLM
jgi:hypothetical protein